MTRRADEHHDEDATTQFAPVDGTDAFLDALARGEDPTYGSDPLAGLLLGMKRDIERPMPEAPSVDGVEPEPLEPISLAKHRTKRAQAGGDGLGETAGRRQATSPKRPGMNPWAAGFIGAAAASALIAGSGAALYNATPGSPLWGASTVVFSDRAAAVELASTLKEIEVASQAGDSDYVAQLLQQANRLVESMKPVPGPGEGEHAGDVGDDRGADRPATVTVTVTVSPEQERPAQPEKPAQQETTAPAQPSAAQPAPNTQQAPQPTQPAQPAQPAQPQAPPPSAQQNQPAPQSQVNQGQPQNNQQAPRVSQPGQQSLPKVQTSAPQGDGQVPQVVPQQSPQVNTQSSYGARVDEVTPQVVPAQ